MTEETKFVVRACCSAGAARKRGYAARADDMSVSGFGYTSTPGPPVAEIEHEPSERVAWHEASHAAIGHGQASKIVSVSIAPPARVEFARSDNPDPFGRAVNALAGAAGEDARAHHPWTESDANVADYIDRTYSFEGGGCDGCSAALGAWGTVGFEAGRDAAIAAWRRGEAVAASLLARPDVRAAVAELAAALMVEHRLDGARAHEIIANHIEFGALRKEVEERKECSES